MDSNRFRIDMIETARGCPENCFMCGAYKDYKNKYKTLDRSIIERNIQRVIDQNGLEFNKDFNRDITTHPATEILYSDAFNHLAEYIYEESDGECRMISISHGAREGNIKMIERLERNVDLMEKRIINMFVLSLDFGRKKGKFNRNFESYLQTLKILKRALGKARITVSIQGDNDPESPLFIGRAKEMFDKLVSELAITNEQINVNERVYVALGRAKNLDVNDDFCDVIPDPEFVENGYQNDHQYRGLIDFNGDLLVQPNRPGRTYNDSLDNDLWQRFVNH